jgi:Sulfotransferase family
MLRVHWRLFDRCLPASMLWGIVATSLFLLPAANAMPSSDCLRYVIESQGISDRKWPSPRRRPLCGSLDQTLTGVRFMDRLSPSCKQVMAQYSNPDMRRQLKKSADNNEEIDESFQSNSREETQTPARTRSSTDSAPTNPVVVEQDDVANFVACTVPKAGCTLMRSLLYVLTRPVSGAMSFTDMQVQTAQYPTVWHYNEQTEPSDTYPTFVIGRNPYIRLVSGFLDKLVVGDFHDWVILRRVYQDLGLPEDYKFEATAESFQDFVVRLSEASHRNPHFDTAVHICNMATISYRYQHPYLPPASVDCAHCHLLSAAYLTTQENVCTNLHAGTCSALRTWRNGIHAG